MKTSRAAALAIACLLASCNDRPAAAPPPATVAAAPVAAAPVAAAPVAPVAAAVVDHKAAAIEIFGSRCTPCHGPRGAGDGPASAGLTPKPASFSSPEWQASVTDEHIEKVILYGGMAVGKSAAMPPNPDLGSKPEVVTALREHLRAMKK